MTNELTKINEFPFNTVYVGSDKDFGEDFIKMKKDALFVTPYIGIASIFTTDRSLYKIPKNRSLNIGYDEWAAKDLNKPFKEIHVRLEGAPEIKPFSFKATGYIYEIDISNLKDNLYRKDWMDGKREALICKVDKVKISKRIKWEHTVHVRGTDEVIHESTIFSKKKLMYHISTDPKLEELKPRIPSYLKKGGETNPDYPENKETKRICVSSSIEGCLRAIINFDSLMTIDEKRYYVYIPEKPFEEYKHKTNKEIIKDKDVFDANITKESWILEPCKMKLYGIIKVKQVKDRKIKKTINSDANIGVLNFDWDWIVKPGVFEESNLLISNEEFFTESKLSTKERNDLKDSEFGIPEERSYPLNDADHVKQAVKMFKHAPDKYKKELAHRIIRKAKEFKLDYSGWDSLSDYIKTSGKDDKIMEHGYDPEDYEDNEIYEDSKDEIYNEAFFGIGFGNLRKTIADKLGEFFTVTNVQNPTGKEEKFTIKSKENTADYVNVVSMGNGVKAYGYKDSERFSIFNNASLSVAAQKLIDSICEIFNIETPVTESYTERNVNIMNEKLTNILEAYKSGVLTTEEATEKLNIVQEAVERNLTIYSEHNIEAFQNNTDNYRDNVINAVTKNLITEEWGPELTYIKTDKLPEKNEIIKKTAAEFLKVGFPLGKDSSKRAEAAKHLYMNTQGKQFADMQMVDGHGINSAPAVAKAWLRNQVKYLTVTNIAISFFSDPIEKYQVFPPLDQNFRGTKAGMFEMPMGYILSDEQKKYHGKFYAGESATIPFEFMEKQQHIMESYKLGVVNATETVQLIERIMMEFDMTNAIDDSIDSSEDISTDDVSTGVDTDTAEAEENDVPTTNAQALADYINSLDESTKNELMSIIGGGSSSDTSSDDTAVEDDESPLPDDEDPADTDVEGDDTTGSDSDTVEGEDLDQAEPVEEEAEITADDSSAADTSVSDDSADTAVSSENLAEYATMDLGEIEV